MFSKSLFVLKLVGHAFSLLGVRISSLIAARFHLLTYKTVADAEFKNVVVIGGSFAGFFLARSLAESLPSGYRVILVERHSHFHFTWNFPRSTVVSGQEERIFIPYSEKLATAPEGSYVHKQAQAVAVETGKVRLDGGEVVEYDFLALATGSRRRYPAALEADERHECVDFFVRQQTRIEAAKRIVIVGGGAAGVELAGDIKSKYSDKTVVLVHSRERLLNAFGKALSYKAKTALEGLGVELHLGERLISGLDLQGPGEVMLRSGKVLPCDLVVLFSLCAVPNPGC
jgi:apoptosis-inducing factor 2